MAALPMRAFMLDVTRDRVPTRASLEFLVRLLARCGYTHLQLYCEYAFAYEGHEDVWRGASPLTAEDMAWCDELCAAAGLKLVPTQNTLGHMERWLATPKHAHRAEKPEGFELWGSYHKPSTIEPNDENYELVKDLLEQIAAPVHSSREINVCLDEPWELGQGKSRARAEAEGVGVVHRRWLTRVAQPWLDRGYTVWFWGDVLLHHPEAYRDLPEGIIPIMWTYDSPDSFAEQARRQGHEPDPDRGFTHMAKRARELSLPFAVAPGTGTWNSITGRGVDAMKNIVDAVQVGTEYGACGFVHTCWGDTGHWEGYVHALVPLIAGGWAATHPDEVTAILDVTFLTRLVGDVLFCDPSHPGAEFLVRLGRLESLYRRPVGNSAVAFLAMFSGKLADDIPQGALDDVVAEIAALRSLAEQLPDSGWVDEALQSLEISELAVERLRGGSGLLVQPLVDRITRNWLATSRPGGLHDSLRRIQGLDAELPPLPDGPEPGGHHYAGLFGSIAASTNAFQPRTQAPSSTA